MLRSSRMQRTLGLSQHWLETFVVRCLFRLPPHHLSMMGGGEASFVDRLVAAWVLQHLRVR